MDVYVKFVKSTLTFTIVGLRLYMFYLTLIFDFDHIIWTIYRAYIKVDPVNRTKKKRII